MNNLRLSGVVSIILALATPAFSHPYHVEHGAFTAGFNHPLFGLDHVITMVVVGLWAVMSGRTAMVALPAAFVGAMIAGFGLSLLKVGLPMVEPVILASVIALGVLVASAAKVNVPVATAIVALFGLFHGHAHGAELGQAGAAQFLLGFVLASSILQMAGMALGLTIGRSPIAARMIGAGAALTGAVLALG